MADTALYRSRDSLTGLGLVAVILMVAVVAWLVSRPDAQGPYLVSEYDAVYGLAQGDPVVLNGLQVGSVEDIAAEFLDMGGVRFRVTLRLSADLQGPADSLLLNRGTQAVIVPPALPFLGRAQVRLVPDFEQQARLPDGAVVEGIAGTALLESLGDQAGQLAASVNQITADISTLMDSLQATRTEADRTLRMIQQEVPAVTAMLEGQLSSVDSLVRVANAEVARTGPEVRELLDSLTLMSNEARALMVSVDETVRTRVPNVDLLLARLDSTSFVAKNLVEKISERPLRVFWGVDVPDSIPQWGGTPIPADSAWPAYADTSRSSGR